MSLVLILEFQNMLLNYDYRPHTEYDGKVMFLLCVSVHSPPPPLVKVQIKGPGQGLGQGLGGHPGQGPGPGGPGQGLGAPKVKVQPPPQVKVPPLVKVQKCGERGRYASCGHAGGLFKM